MSDAGRNCWLCMYLSVAGDIGIGEVAQAEVTQAEVTSSVPEFDDKLIGWVFEDMTL